jgi:hypothetical protein
VKKRTWRKDKENRMWCGYSPAPFLKRWYRKYLKSGIINMKIKIIMVSITLLILLGGIQQVSSMGPPTRDPETVTALITIEPETLNLNSQSINIYANIALQKYDVSNIDTNSVVLITPNGVEIPGYFETYIEDDLGTVIAVKFRFVKQDLLDEILPVEDGTTVPLIVQGDINSKWWEISFSGTGTIKIIF